MKFYTLLPIVLLGACAHMTTPEQDVVILDESQDVIVRETPAKSIPASATDRIIQPQPVALNPVPVQQAPSIPVYTPAPVVYQPVPASGTYVQPIAYTQPPVITQQPVQQVQPVYQHVAPYYAAVSPAIEQQAPAETVVITLQHPAQQGTIAQCLSTDIACITSYEQQGFVQVRDMPQMAGYQEILSPSDYPAGQWRNQNNIPRW